MVRDELTNGMCELDVLIMEGQCTNLWLYKVWLVSVEGVVVLVVVRTDLFVVCFEWRGDG